MGWYGRGWEGGIQPITEVLIYENGVCISSDVEISKLSPQVSVPLPCHPSPPSPISLLVYIIIIIV